MGHILISCETMKNGELNFIFSNFLFFAGKTLLTPNRLSELEPGKKRNVAVTDDGWDRAANRQPQTSQDARTQQQQNPEPYISLAGRETRKCPQKCKSCV